MAPVRTGFRNLFEDAYQGRVLEEAVIRKAFSAEAALEQLPGGLGHPDYEHLKLGESELGEAVILFYDIRGCTKLAIALESDELLRIIDALTKASIISVQLYGGYVGEFTGDGIMAYFGGTKVPTADAVFNALRAAAFMMQGIKEVANDYLNRQGDETAKVGMGIELGQIRWARIGTENVHQVKPIGAASFFAGKASSYAAAWECIVGQNLAKWIPAEFQEPIEALEFQHNKVKYKYERSRFNWQKFFTEFCENPKELIRLSKQAKLPLFGISATAVVPGLTSSTGSGGPKKLKDQPFFGEHHD